MAWCKTTPWIKANLCHDMHVMCMWTPPRKFQSPDCGNFIDTNVFNQTFRIYTQTMMEKTFFDVRVFNPHAFSNRNQTPSACYRKHKREKKRTYAQRILEVEHLSFTPLVFSATCRRNRERSNLFLQTSWLLYAHSEVGSLIQHHTLLAEMLIDLLPVCSAIQSLRRARSSQHHVVHSPAAIDLTITESHHSRLLNPLFHLKLSLLCKHCEYSRSSFVVHLIQHYFQFFSFPRWRVSRTAVCVHKPE